MKNKGRKIRKILLVFLCLAALGICAVFGINGYVKSAARDRLVTPEKAAEIADVDCILVLGCQVKSGGRPSDMLGDRIRRGLELYELGAAPKLLMSGDHGRSDYDEVGAMKRVAVEAGVPSEDVFMDHAGFSTYESVYRAREIFGADKIIIVTQEYHLYRALYIAERLGVEAYGVSSDYYAYAGQSVRDLREILARNKDFITTVFKPKPTFLGDKIPISGSGDATND